MAYDLSVLQNELDFKRLMHEVREASITLAGTPGSHRSRGLQRMAKALQAAQDEILEANTLDLEACQDMAVPERMQEWLKLTPERLQDAVKILRALGNLTDPLQRVMPAHYAEEQSQTYTQLMPLGVIALVYEALPELGAIAAGLCLRTGNSLILRGGTETSHSNAAIVGALQQGLEEAGLPAASVMNFCCDQGNSLRDLLAQEQCINLIIPYGRPSLVQKTIQQATVPVLKTGIGNCYLYWSASADLETVRWMVADSHATEPDPVNAIEKVLVSQDLGQPALYALWNSLREADFKLRGDEDLAAEFPSDLTLAEEAEWSQPYLDRIVAFRRVDRLEAAVTWINNHSSGHADALATQSYSESRYFSRYINSATLHINNSPRFYRNPTQGHSLALGMSNQKGHRRGRIGLETLTTLKQIVLGNGQLET
jgi:glutamate-5-semialdehyde dehydrogenase